MKMDNIPMLQIVGKERMVNRIKVGNFKMNFNDGAVRFKTKIDVKNTELNPVHISNRVYADGWTRDRRLPGILTVVYSDKLPKEAIEEVEK
jgi:hypothetical protein